MKIIYENDGGVAIITPTEEALKNHTIKQIADKDVPAGKPYHIVDVPLDRTFRYAWEVDESLLTDGVGSKSSEFEVSK